MAAITAPHFEQALARAGYHYLRDLAADTPPPGTPRQRIHAALHQALLALAHREDSLWDHVNRFHHTYVPDTSTLLTWSATLIRLSHDVHLLAVEAHVLAGLWRASTT